MLNPDGTKTCPHCKLPLPTSSFYAVTRKLGDGFSGYCKACTRIRAVEWQKANPQKMAQQREKQTKKRSDQRKAGLYPPERKAQENEACKRWRQENPERAAEVQKNHIQAKKDRDLGYYRAEAALSNNRRRARMKGIPSDATMDDWSKLRAVFEGCAYCGAHPKLIDLDHVVPLHLGGYDVIGNIVPACRICNAHKGCQDPRQFAKEMDLDLREIMTKAAVRISTFPTDDGKLLGTPV